MSCSVGLNFNGTANGARLDRVFVVVEANEQGLGH